LYFGYNCFSEIPKFISIECNRLSRVGLSKRGNRTVVRFFGGEDVKLSTLEKITNILGLDFAGNEMVDIDILREQRAKERALYIVSLVQDTSALEMQGLEKRELDILIEDTKREFIYGAYQKNLWAS
jgi:hypothetical protein